MKDKTDVDRDYIETAIAEIMLLDGPDGHIDGHEVIADFVMHLLQGNGDAWLKKYLKTRDEREKERGRTWCIRVTLNLPF